MTILRVALFAVVSAACLTVAAFRARITDWLVREFGGTGFWVLAALAFVAVLGLAHVVDKNWPQPKTRRRPRR